MVEVDHRHQDPAEVGVLLADVDREVPLGHRRRRRGGLRVFAHGQVARPGLRRAEALGLAGQAAAPREEPRHGRPPRFPRRRREKRGRGRGTEAEVGDRVLGSPEDPPGGPAEALLELDAPESELERPHRKAQDSNRKEREEEERTETETEAETESKRVFPLRCGGFQAEGDGHGEAEEGEADFRQGGGHVRHSLDLLLLLLVPVRARRVSCVGEALSTLLPSPMLCCCRNRDGEERERLEIESEIGLSSGRHARLRRSVGVDDGKNARD
ncbi:hypothetical protein EUGRSUZ_E01473 [Eucalyptus grandis]|uniref:Uncharacterized protein n=2 Tax=Eucalyptus grandis TaxID=71139 RepID=A0ACC3KUJ0_EUCGR|nr:hypothetical protein EUGRSUZ_E01473 [Eucalyptus grandis]